MVKHCGSDTSWRNKMHGMNCPCVKMSTVVGKGLSFLFNDSEELNPHEWWVCRVIPSLRVIIPVLTWGGSIPPLHITILVSTWWGGSTPPLRVIIPVSGGLGTSNLPRKKNKWANGYLAKIVTSQLVDRFSLPDLSSPPMSREEWVR